MSPMLSPYVAVSNFISDRVERFKSGEDRGASMIEYGALLILISAIIAALLATNVDNTIATKISETVTKIFEGGEAK